MSKYRIIFLGPSSSGKTSTIQTLLQNQPANSASPPTIDESNAIPMTQRSPTVHKEVILDKEVTLVDTPGPSDPRHDSDNDMVIRTAFHAVSPGPHALVLVFSVSTPYDIIRQTFNRFQERLGASAMRYTIMLFTGVDQLESDGRTFQGYIDNLPRHIKPLVVGGGGHNYVAFNNNATARLINVLQVREFMSKLERIYNIHHGLHYDVRQSRIGDLPVMLTTCLTASDTEAFLKNMDSLELVEKELNRSEITTKNHQQSKASSSVELELVPHPQIIDDKANIELPITSAQNQLQSVAPGSTAAQPPSGSDNEGLLLESMNSSNTQRGDDGTMKSRECDNASVGSTRKQQKCNIFCCWSCRSSDPEFNRFN